MNITKDERDIPNDYTHDSIKNVIAKPDEKRVEIIVTLQALIEIPERWIIKDSNGKITLENEDDVFFIGLRKNDRCLTREIDFGLVDYIDTDEPTIRHP